MLLEAFKRNLQSRPAAVAAAIIALAGATSAHAEGKLTGGMWATNDFLDYGVPRTEHKPAVQAELTYQLPKRFYAGVFTSSVNDGLDYGQEFQAMFGAQTEVRGFEIDAFVNHHMFAGMGDFQEDSFLEMELDVTRGFGPVEAMAALVGGPVDGGAFEGFGFLGFASEVPLPHDFALQGSFGRLMFSDVGEEDYFHYTSGVAWTHPAGFEIFGGLEGVSLDGELHPVIRIGRAF